MESAFPGDLGFKLALLNPDLRYDAQFFGETQGRIVISVSKENLSNVEVYLKNKNCPFKIIGEVTSHEVNIKPLNIQTSIKELKNIYDSALPEILG